MTASNNCLSALLNDVNSTNCTVQELLLYQKSNLQTKLSAVVMFAADKDKFSHWVEGVQESLDLIEEEDVHTDVSKLEKKLHKAKVNISAHKCTPLHTHYCTRSKIYWFFCRVSKRMFHNTIQCYTK